MRQLATALSMLAAMAVTGPGAARAEGEAAGDFDYYVMALSWSPNWCTLEGDARGAPECDGRRDLAFTLHGLWPQYEEGWPSFCRTAERDPTRSQSDGMADIMGSSGLAWYQWKKHGRCSGLSATEYYAAMREAVESVTVPPVFSQMTKTLKVPAEVIEGAFLESNPGMTRDQITITCKDGFIQEVRICLTKDLEPRRCGNDVIRDCRMKDAILGAIR